MYFYETGTPKKLLRDAIKSLTPHFTAPAEKQVRFLDSPLKNRVENYRRVGTFFNVPSQIQFAQHMQDVKGGS